MDNVTTMFSVREMPWHKKGKILNNPPTSEEAIKEAGLDWEVELKQMFWKDKINNEFYPFPNRCALVRKSDDNPLAIVSDHYQALQNRKAFEWFDPIVQGNQAVYETAGSLKNGQKDMDSGKTEG